MRSLMLYNIHFQKNFLSTWPKQILASVIIVVFTQNENIALLLESLLITFFFVRTSKIGP